MKQKLLNLSDYRETTCKIPIYYIILYNSFY